MVADSDFDCGADSLRVSSGKVLQRCANLFFTDTSECYGFTYNFTRIASKRVYRGLNERELFALQSA
jgi:hypothetical protein